MALSVEIQLLDQRLLSPITTVFPAPLTDEEKISVNAFLVLGHACVEEFIEDSFARHARRLCDLALQPLIPVELAHLSLAFGISSSERMQNRNPYGRRTLTSFLAAGLQQYEDVAVSGNHGVKTPNVKKLAKGVGLEWTSFESALAQELADLDNLGSRRGEAGHLAPLTTKATKITNRVDPEDVRRWVTAGLDAALAIRHELDRRTDSQLTALIAA